MPYLYVNTRSTRQTRRERERERGAEPRKQQAYSGKEKGLAFSLESLRARRLSSGKLHRIVDRRRLLCRLAVRVRPKSQSINLPGGEGDGAAA